MTEQGTNEVTPETQGPDSEILATVHRMARQVDEMWRVFVAMRPVLEAYQRGGMLGARTAAKRMGKG